MNSTVNKFQKELLPIQFCIYSYFTVYLVYKSNPIDRRTNESLIPTASRWSSGTEAYVMIDLQR